MQQPPAPNVIPPRIHANPWIILAVLTLGLFMNLVDTTIVNIAIPNMEKGLNAGFDEILWVLNGYLLIYAVLLITAGRLGDMFGPKLMFLLGIAVFTAASVACGFAHDASQLIAFRVIQGIGGAMLTPQTLSLISAVFPPEKRGTAFGIWSATSGLAVIIGPVLGGFLVTNYDWPSIFFVNLPFGVVAVVAGALLVPEVRSGRKHSIDIPGIALISSSLTIGVFALVEGQKYAWGPINTAASFSIGSTRWSLISCYSLLVYSAVLIGVFLAYEARRQDDEPLVPLLLFKDRNYSGGNAAMFIVSFAIFGLSLPFTIYMQTVLGFTAIHAGLTTVPQALALMIIAPFAGRMADRGRGKATLFFGFSAYAVGVGLLLYVLALDNTSWSFTPALIISGIGMGCLFSPLITLTMRTIPPMMTGAASGVFNTTRQVGSVLGSAIVGTVLANIVAQELPKQAAKVAPQLPPSARSHFLAVWQAASRGTQRFGTGQDTSGKLPAGVPHQLAVQIASLSHHVFAESFLTGARTALWLPVISIALGALVVITMRSRAANPTAVEVDAPAVPEPAPEPA